MMQGLKSQLSALGPTISTSEGEEAEHKGLGLRRHRLLGRGPSPSPKKKEKPPAPKLAYEMTKEELDESVRKHVRDHFASKKPPPVHQWSEEDKKYFRSLLHPR